MTNRRTHRDARHAHIAKIAKRANRYPNNRYCAAGDCILPPTDNGMCIEHVSADLECDLRERNISERPNAVPACSNCGTTFGNDKSCKSCDDMIVELRRHINADISIFDL